MLNILNFVPIFVIVLIMYFLLIRPQQREQKQKEEMLQNMIKGDEVITTGGISGKIIDIKDDRVSIESGNSQINVLRTAITQVLKKVKKQQKATIFKQKFSNSKEKRKSKNGN